MGDKTALIFSGIFIFTSLVGSIIILIFAYQKRYYRHIREKEQLKAQYSEEILKSQLEIQEETLKIISQEIHDNIGQILSLAKLNLNTIDISKQKELNNKISAAKENVDIAIKDLRALSKSLNAESIIDMGLKNAIGYELDMINKTEIYQTHLQVDGEIPKMDDQKELILFRIVQESLHNIIKHGKEARNINVVIRVVKDLLEIEIIDDGKGFDTEKPLKSEDEHGGMGLRNMKNRARLINAELNITSKINEGTRVKLVLPLHITNQ